jgi:hypothetical protein
MSASGRSGEFRTPVDGSPPAWSVGISQASRPLPAPSTVSQMWLSPSGSEITSSTRPWTQARELTKRGRPGSLGVHCHCMLVIDS